MTAWVLGADDEPTVLVTQCSDVEQARRIALLTIPDDIALSLTEWDDASHDLALDAITETMAQLVPRIEYGRMLPSTDPDYGWFWRGWPAEGRERAHGETTAVHFRQPPYEGAAG